VGPWHGEFWFIDEGLVAGERVVVDGALTLTAGASVEVTQTLAARAENGDASPK
jgi:membrane fusion protein (multidrug efflux system)